jgi:hypothetical protein
MYCLFKGDRLFTVQGPGSGLSNSVAGQPKNWFRFISQFKMFLRRVASILERSRGFSQTLDGVRNFGLPDLGNRNDFTLAINYMPLQRPQLSGHRNLFETTRKEGGSKWQR